MSNTIDTALGFHRQFRGPLDSTSVFSDLNSDNKLVYDNKTFDTPEDLADYYAKKDIAYSGQIIGIKDPETKEFLAFIVCDSISGESLTDRYCIPVGKVEVFFGDKIAEVTEIPLENNN